MRTLFRWSSVAFFLFWGQSFAQSAQNKEISEWILILTRLNQPIFAEPAGSHGSSGLQIGGGLSQIRIPESANPVKNLELPSHTSNSLQASKLWITKGFPWPIDLLFTGTKSEHPQLTQASMGIQWNFFEMPKLPIIAIRAHRGGVFGLPASEIKSNGIELAFSYSPMPSINFFSNAGYYYHHLDLHIDQDSPLAWLKERESVANSIMYLKEEEGFSFGLRIQSAMHFLAISSEIIYRSQSLVGGALRFSFGL